VLVNLEERAYYKEDAGKLLLGLFEERGKAWATHGIPEDFDGWAAGGNDQRIAARVWDDSGGLKGFRLSGDTLEQFVEHPRQGGCVGKIQLK
jgi:hypothetical protein